MTAVLARAGRVAQVGIIVASMLDAWLTWTMLQAGRAQEANPAGVWLHTHFGLTGSAFLRILAGCFVACVMAHMCRTAKSEYMLRVFCSASIVFASAWGLIVVNNLRFLG